MPKKTLKNNFKNFFESLFLHFYKINMQHFIVLYVLKNI